MGIANQSKKWQKVPFPISSQVPLTTQPPFQPIDYPFDQEQIMPEETSSAS